MTFKEAMESGDRSAVADKVFLWTAVILVTLAIVWFVIAVLDVGLALAILFIGAVGVVAILVVLFAAAGLADIITDMLM